MIKFVDLKEEINEIKHIIQPKIDNMLYNECCYINGKYVSEFENNFAKYCKCFHSQNLSINFE